MDVYNCAKGHLPKCIINAFMAVVAGGGTDLGYQPVALFHVFRSNTEKFTPPPQVGIDTNLQFEIFQKKVHPPHGPY